MEMFIATLLALYVIVNFIAVWLCTTGLIHPPFFTLFLFSIVFPLVILLLSIVAFIWTNDESIRGMIIIAALIVVAAAAWSVNCMFLAASAV